MIQHVVKRQVFDLIIEQSLNAFHIQEQVSRQFRNQIQPMLNRIFDDRTATEEITAIDRLEINLGIIDMEEIETEIWTKGLKEKIEKLLDGLSVPQSYIGKRTSLPLRISLMKEWFYYMQQGYLNWTRITLDEDWPKLVLEALAVDYDGAEQLRRIILNEGPPLTRIVSQHSAAFLLSVVEVLTAQKHATLPDAIDKMVARTLRDNLKQELPVPISERQLKKECWMLMLQNAANKKLTDTSTLTTQELNGLIMTKSEPGKQIENKEWTDKNELRNTEPKKRPAIGTNKTEHKSAIPMDADGIIVENAGIVILHAFLKTGFGRMGLLDGNQFKDVAAKEKALFLLHYMATGKKEAEEFELVIPKIICDFPLEQAVDIMTEIKEEQYTEADSLLDAVISQWEKLQNPSREALREGFLRRSGKLSERNQEDLVQVEKSAIDVLMNYLPWSVSLIMLPWRKELLRVEWC